MTEHSPLPWAHKEGHGKTSAIVDAEGKVVTGSLICMQSPQDVSNHKFIMECLEKAWMYDDLCD